MGEYTKFYINENSGFNDTNGGLFLDSIQNSDWDLLKNWINQKPGRKAPPKAPKKAQIKDVFEDTDNSFNIFETSANFLIKTKEEIKVYWVLIKDSSETEFDSQKKEFTLADISGIKTINFGDNDKKVEIPSGLENNTDYKLKLMAFDTDGRFVKDKTIRFKTKESGLIFEDLEKEFILNAGNGKYLLNNKTIYNEKERYKLGKGIYTLKDVPIEHPVAIISESSKISYYGVEENRVTDGISNAIDGYFYYHGDVRIIVKGDFKAASLHCGYHGYMGSENILHYDKNKSGEDKFKSNKVEELSEDKLDLDQLYFGLDNSFEIELPESAALSQQGQNSFSRDINSNILLSDSNPVEKMPKILLKEISGNNVLREIEAKNIKRDEFNGRKYKGDISFNIKPEQKLEDISKNEYEFDIIFDQSNNIIEKKKTYKIKAKVKRPKILCLHGGGQTVDDFKNQDGMKDLRDNLGREFEFIFADSTKRKKIGTEIDVDEAVDVWWKDPPSKGEPTTDISHADVSIKYLDEKIEEEKPVYGILGYSQGAAMATTYLASKNDQGEERSKKFEKAFLYNGYLPTTHLGLMEKINDSSLNIPTMIYVSEKDEVIPPELTTRMRNKFKRHKKISTDKGGHRLPKRKEQENDEKFKETLDFIRRRKEKEEDILVDDIEAKIPVIEEFEYSDPTDSSLNIYVKLNVNGKIRLNLRQEQEDKNRAIGVKKNKIQFKDNDDDTKEHNIKVGFHDKGYNEKDKDWTEAQKPEIKKYYQTFHREVSGNKLVTFNISGLVSNEKYIVECHGKGINGYVSRPRRIIFTTKEDIHENSDDDDGHDDDIKEIFVKLKTGSVFVKNYIQFSFDQTTWFNNHDKPDWAIKGKKYVFIVSEDMSPHHMEFIDYSNEIIKNRDDTITIDTNILTGNILKYKCLDSHTSMIGEIILNDEVSIQPVPNPIYPKPILEHIHIGIDRSGEFKFYKDFRFGSKNLDWPLIDKKYPILFKNRAYKFINYTNKPFYILENKETMEITNVHIIGDGSSHDGITGDKHLNKIRAESFILTFKPSFNINENQLFYYDTNESGNFKVFEVLRSKEKIPTTSLAPIVPVVINNQVIFNILNKVRDSRDNVTQNEINEQERIDLEAIKVKSMEILEKYIIEYPKSYNIQLGWGDFTQENMKSIMGYAIPSQNRIVLNKAKIADESTLNGESVKTLTVTLIHEILHIFGLIGINIDETTTTQDVIINERKYIWKLYVANKGLAQYKNLLTNLKNVNSNTFRYQITKTNIEKLQTNEINSLKYILLEDDFGEGTVHVHLEEGINENYTLEQKITLVNGEQLHYPSIMNEITTGFQNQKTYLTRITLGMLEDLNFKINYTALDEEEKKSGYFSNIIIV